MSILQSQFTKRGTYIAILILMVFAPGCMNPMALNKKADTVDLSQKSIALFTLRASNEYKPGFKPNASWILIKTVSSGKSLKFGLDKPHANTGKFNEYLVSVEVESGKHTLKRVGGVSNRVLIIGTFSFGFNETFEIPLNSVTYVGHVNMNNRERKKGETRSGSIFPLIDQAVAGYSGGTFDVTISDRSATDIALFTQTYPCLKDIQIGKALMQK